MGMVHIIDVEFLPSEILYQMEPETYRVHLAEFDGPTDSISSDAQESE